MTEHRFYLEMLERENEPFDLNTLNVLPTNMLFVILSFVFDNEIFINYLIETNNLDVLKNFIYNNQGNNIFLINFSNNLDIQRELMRKYLNSFVQIENTLNFINKNSIIFEKKGVGIASTKDIGSNIFYRTPNHIQKTNIPNMFNSKRILIKRILINKGRYKTYITLTVDNFSCSRHCHVINSNNISIELLFYFLIKHKNDINFDNYRNEYSRLTMPSLKNVLNNYLPNSTPSLTLNDQKILLSNLIEFNKVKKICKIFDLQDLNNILN